MTHDEALSLLNSRIDGPLSSDQQQSLEAWLAESADNQVLAEAFQSTHVDLRTTFEPRRAAVKETAAAVARQLGNAPTPTKERPASRWRKLMATPLPAACAAAILIGLGLLIFHSSRMPNKPGVSNLPELARIDYDEVGLKARKKPDAPKTAELAVGKSVETPPGEKRRVRLPDGSFVYLNQNTKVELTGDRHIKLRSGNIFIEAVRAQSEAQRLIVETASKSVTALGTKFAVSADKDGKTGVLVTQGKVEVSGLSDQLTSGQELLPGKEKIEPAPRASAALEWTKDLMIAAESPLVPAGKHSGSSLVAVDPYGQEAKLSLTKFHVDVHIEDGFARTTIDQTYFNSENFRMEGTFYFPLPPDASLSRLAMYVDGDLMEGGMADRGHARDVYERIRYQNRDPALLEWVDGSVFKMRVFPLEARQEKRIILSYSQRLPVLYGHMTYRFPAGHTLAMVDKWSFHADVKGGAMMSAMSPSHPAMKFENVGQNLVANDEANGVKVDRDVVLELNDHSTAQLTPIPLPRERWDTGNVRWSSAEQDGQKYLMVRFRPDLPSAPRRERRDWVFLFESSGARDPLVARAQVEVIRSLLTHAEHEDKFSILSVGTRVRQWSATPQAATPENVEEAIKWLDHRHLIGALNLNDALSQASAILQTASNPHLVHVGGGIASIGEQRADVLVKRIPEGTKYVGVGVGKRFSPAFMKVAAEKTGGLFTQVNPDEPIAWRGFEIASTLNAPRLLNVRVDAPMADGCRFLTFSNVLAHGEELAAVTRINGAPPQAVTVRGILDGQVWERKLPMSNVADGAGYLPRTWAKLEIDRLLAEDSSANEKAITELSKAMYVMTPFTSLLVLENEQMYKDFKVDRGRKDHWAMYPCPPKIPVVYIPDPNQPASRVDLKGQKPHENQVLQTIMTRNPPRYLTWPGQNNGDQPIETSGKWAFALPMMGGADADDFELLDVEGGGEMDEMKRDEKARESLLLRDHEKSRKGKKDLAALDMYMGKLSKSGGENGRMGVMRAGATRFREVTVTTSNGTQRVRVPYTVTRGEIRDSELAAVDGITPYFKTPVRVGEVIIRGNTVTQDRIIRRELADLAGFGSNLAFDAPPTANAWHPPARGYFGLSSSTPEALVEIEQLMDSPRGEDRKKLKEFFKSSGLADRRSALNEWGEAKPMSNRTLAVRGVFLNRPQPLDGNEVLSEVLGGVRLSDVREERQGQEMLGYMALGSTAPQYYGRPSFSGNFRVFSDLVAYAPGMSSSVADVQMVLEAEAAPRFGQRLGSVDPDARKLIESARSTEWKSLKLGDLAFIHDGSGRYAYERTVAFGLKEKVVCDGTHLWHLYPELGIGAKRVVSRFHREFLFDLIPDFLPPADDLAHGADVKAIDEKTVALSPLMPPKDQEQPIGWLETRLVFDSKRLAERQWVLVQKGKPDEILIREVYEANKVKWFTPNVGQASRLPEKDGQAGRLPYDPKKPLAESKREESPAAAPDLSPDMSKLVVLPLPLRSREEVYRQLDMEPSWGLNQEKNACFEYLPKDDAMKLLACEFAANNGANVARVWDTCFAPGKDYRTGFFTLMAAAGYNPRTYWQFNQEKFEKNPSDPLVRYLWEMWDDNIHDWQARLGFGPGRNDADTFLGKLTTFRRIHTRWQGNFINHGLWGQRDTERERAVEFAKRNADNVLGWCALAMVQDVCPSRDAWKTVASGWTVLAEKSALRYPARYEEARCLGNAKMNEEAQKKYQDLFAAALNEGVLPPLDASFRNVLESGKEDIWAKLMRETARECASAKKKARPMIVTLAWQCYQLGDTAMSDTLLDLALDKIPDEEKPYTSIAAIHFLNATSRYDRADSIVRDLLSNPDLAKSAGLWRLASQTAANRKDPVREIDCLEKALDIEYARLPEVFDVQPIRNDYGRLLNHYEWLADASASLRVSPPKDLNVRLVKAADRWRQLDPEAQDVPNHVAAILRKVGGEGSAELAWDYATTPLALKPNEAGPWTSLAWSVRQEGNWRLADKCYEMAFAAEPTNAQLLWDRAEYLRQQGQIAESKKLLTQLKDGDWQPRFNGLKAQARQAVEGR